eukprot:gene6807-7023_t
MAGTLEYMAPEVLQKKPASQASDLYALAITVNELATGVYPFSDCTKDCPDIHTVLEHGYGRQELATAVAAEGLRPRLPKQAPTGLIDLLQAAWDLNPALRPTAHEFKDRLAYAERYPGCTALAAVITGNQLFVANAGDGRAVISRGGSAVPLSRQHTADLADERARVVAAGGTVVYRGGSWRVGPAALQLSSADEFLILGSDGLWDVMSDQEAVGLVNDTVKDPALCAKRLVQEALARGSNDNVTAVVLFLQPKSTLERMCSFVRSKKEKKLYTVKLKW